MALQVMGSCLLGFPLIETNLYFLPWRSFSSHILSTSTFSNTINESTCPCLISPFWGHFYGWCSRGFLIGLPLWPVSTFPDPQCRSLHRNQVSSFCPSSLLFPLEGSVYHIFPVGCLISNSNFLQTLVQFH